MADNRSYREKLDADRIIRIREISRELPQACGDFLRAIAVTTGTFTRLAYAIDLKTFFHFLQTERVQFSQKPLYAFTDADLALLSQSDLTAYIEYLTFYYKDDPDGSGDAKPLVNHDLSIKRKLCSIRSFYDYLFKNNRIQSNITTLVPLPKIHEKPIIRLTLDEMRRILEQAATGEDLTPRQKAWHKLTVKRDYALMSLFLGTGIRVSECVGINLQDVDLENNAFLVTRKGGNQVVLYFPPEVAEALAEYMLERERIE
ncbi:MAG: tyrosine-type recombinase/integrase, partial [Kiritimatiellae bacterium]|nr:tyrosine-type recombinase/integrase [Kiritimatiellia bacterium]